MFSIFAVAPIIDIVPLEIPYDVNATTHNRTQPELGDSVEWSVSVQAGVGDRLVWTLNGQELPAVEVVSYHEKVTTNISTSGQIIKYIVSPYKQVTLFCNRAMLIFLSFLLLQDINCSKHNNMYYRYDVQEVSQFVRNFTATLFLCNVSRNHSGQYECAIIRSRGDRNPITIWSTQIRSQSSTEPITTDQSESILFYF